ncbi:MAG TPA: hypothetical protein VMY39_10505 [Planctomycetota bacterium]|nr:hypothetical protein [Planctomycetota bacterium]
MSTRVVAAVLLTVVTAGLVATTSARADVAADKYRRFDLGSDADLDATRPVFISPRDRIGPTGTEGDVTYRLLKPGVYQVGVTWPLFDVDAENFHAARHPFYLSVRFKDVAKRGVNVHTGKGGSGFHGAGFVGTFGGDADGKWKEETVIIPRSMIRSEDGKTFRLALNGITAEVPVERMILFSADTTLVDRDARIAAAHKLTDERRGALRKRLLPGFRDLGLPEPGPRPPYTAAETARGFRVFFPPVSRQLFANSEPREGELTDVARVYACPGEAETIVVAVRAIKDLGKVRMMPSAFASPSVVRLGPGRMRWAVYSEQRIGSSWGKDYRVCPEQLVETPSCEVKPERLEIATMTFRVPEEARPGEYADSILITTERGGSLTVPVRITVHPFKLEHPAHATHGLFYYFGYGAYNPIELADQRDHGMNTIVSGCGVSLFPAGRAGTPEGVREVYRCLKRLGYRAPIICNNGFMNRLTDAQTPANRKKYADLVRETLDIARDEGFAEMGFFPVDEPHTDALIAKSLVACTWIKDVPGAHTFITSNPKAVPQLDKVLDYVCYNLTYITAERIAEVKRSGDTLMFYCPSFDVDPELNRYRAGFYQFRTGAHSAQFFAYMGLAGDPFVDLDSGNRDWNVVYPSMTSATHDPTIAWEALREGVDDWEYAYTLKATVERARKAGKLAAADKAMKILDDVLAVVDVDGKKAGGPAMHIEADVRLKNEKLDPAELKRMQEQMSSAWYDESRRKIAQAIIELKRALGE